MMDFSMIFLCSHFLEQKFGLNIIEQEYSRLYKCGLLHCGNIQRFLLAVDCGEKDMLKKKWILVLLCFFPTILASLSGCRSTPEPLSSDIVPTNAVTPTSIQGNTIPDAPLVTSSILPSSALIPPLPTWTPTPGQAWTPDPTPSWRGITPGQSTKDEVIELLGQPDEIHPCEDGEIQVGTMGGMKENCGDGLLLYRYFEMVDLDSNTRITKKHQVYFQDETVTLIQELWPTRENSEDSLLIADYLDLHGLPEQVTWSSCWFTRARALLYCQQGLIIHSDLLGAAVAVFYFEPMTTSECLQVFRTSIPEVNPELGTTVRIPKDPWVLTKPDDMPDYLFDVWPEPDGVMSMESYNIYLDPGYSRDHYGQGIGVYLASQGHGFEAPATNLSPEGIRLFVNGVEISNEELSIKCIEDNRHCRLIWPIELTPGAYEAQFKIFDKDGELHSYTWQFMLTDG
jgi:hypothetical protein